MRARMTWYLLTALIVAGLLVAGCSRPETGTEPTATTGTTTQPDDTWEPPDRGGEYEIVFEADCKWLEDVAQNEMNSALSREPEIDVVYGHNDPSAHGAFTASQQADQERAETIRFIGIDALPHEGITYVEEGILAATFEYPTGGPQAIRAAALLLSGAEVPKNIALGTTVYTAENVGEGGRYVAPDEKEGWVKADALDEMDEPTLTQEYLVGFSQCNLNEPWRVQMNADVEAAAEAYPEIQLSMKDAQNKTEDQQAQVREFIEQGVDLIIISPKESRPLTEPVAEAMEAGIPVIVLDRKIEGDNYTCFIGGDNVLIGRQAGLWVRETFPDGAYIVELKGLMTSTPAQERHDGFMQGLRGEGAEPTEEPNPEPGTDEEATEPEPEEGTDGESPSANDEPAETEGTDEEPTDGETETEDEPTSE
ncbi:MAG: substrate-binding domain-containing protein [Armatimonadia bacterium]|nr:substrate-binding domain-containing protein [Armatimonadia bacterium]